MNAWLRNGGAQQPARRSMCCDANVRRGKCLRCQGDADAPRGSSGPKPTPFQQHQQRSAGSQASRQRRPNDLGAEVLADIADGLNADQVRALNLALGGESMLLTGGAGTGKSFTLARLIRGLHARHGVEAVFVTGSTGIAGCHVGGTTLHSFAGIGLGKESASELIRRIKGSRASRERWHACAVLVVDEVSMLDAELFEKLEEIARGVIGDARPFGGIQLVLSGDFFQLPPVGLGAPARGAGFCTPGLRFLFDSACWTTVVKHTVVLREVFRQRDERFVRLLEEMRRGRLSPFHASLLRAAVGMPSVCAAPGAAEDTAGARADRGGARPTKLYPRNEPADAENTKRLGELAGAPRRYVAQQRPLDTKALENCLAPALLQLKVGCQVMLLKNLDPARKLVNGARGVVVGFEPLGLPPDKDVLDAPTTALDARSAAADGQAAEPADRAAVCDLATGGDALEMRKRPRTGSDAGGAEGRGGGCGGGAHAPAQPPTACEICGKPGHAASGCQEVSVAPPPHPHDVSSPASGALPAWLLLSAAPPLLASSLPPWPSPPPPRAPFRQDTRGATGGSVPQWDGSGDSDGDGCQPPRPPCGVPVEGAASSSQRARGPSTSPPGCGADDWCEADDAPSAEVDEIAGHTEDPRTGLFAFRVAWRDTPGCYTLHTLEELRQTVPSSSAAFREYLERNQLQHLLEGGASAGKRPRSPVPASAGRPSHAPPVLPRQQPQLQPQPLAGRAARRIYPRVKFDGGTEVAEKPTRVQQ